MSTARTLGAFAVPPAAQVTGPAILLVPKERLTLVPSETTDALTGRVVRVRQSGPHRDVVVELDQGRRHGRTRVEVEARLGTLLGPGDHTAVLLPRSDELWVVRDEAPAVPPSPVTR